MISAPSRRWSFTLRTLFVVVTIAALGAAWIAWEYRTARARYRYLYVDEVSRITSAFDPAKNELSFLRRYFGDTTMMSIWLPIGSTAADIEKARRLFPEAEIQVMYYPS
jgi:hypothetical protein